ncbi:hypothetical protein NC652_026917 [Populus alba x Populus x berolinensis]|nr:hypothetical protein NC652_026917 [Populus alba x Populus x berolinensis]
MLINYQMLAVEMRRQSTLVVAFSSSQFIGICHDKHECNPDPSFLKPLYLAPSFSSLLHCCFSLFSHQLCHDIIRNGVRYAETAIFHLQISAFLLGIPVPMWSSSNDTAFLSFFLCLL